MGSIEGVFILSPTNEPILHSHTLHPLPNYLLLQADQLVAKLEAAASTESVVLPITFTDGLLRPAKELENDPEEVNSPTEVTEDALPGEDEGKIGSALVHIQHNQLRFVATFSRRIDPLLPVSFLNDFVAVLNQYLGAPLNEEAIRENIDTVYQLLEEMLDESGHPLSTEFNFLRDIVKEPSWVNNVIGKVTAVPGIGNSSTPAHVSNIPWRRSHQSVARTTRNEIYVDIVEIMQGSFSRGPQPRALPNVRLRGSIECNSKLSGTPDLCLRLNSTSAMEGLSLHPCVRVKRYKKEGVFTFVPPDGKFTLADFDLQGHERSFEKVVPLSVRCHRQETMSKEASTFHIEVAAQDFVESLEICFQIKERSCDVETTVSGGSRSIVVAGEDSSGLRGAVYHDAKNGLLKWSIDRLERSQKPLVLSGTIRSDTSPQLSSAVTSRFTVPLKTISGVKVASLELLNEVGYHPFKGVRNVLRGDLDWRW